ncbi:ABC transporter substrate-binding protein [Aliiglaciecola sp. LCG003]|uniref:ABC transporter substrate-binding protein n=1 Tax=Aliiglaciecola sp. LCG003 TaxID=3053655 RepID=UPI002573FE41|nr:ABC transporter substrate-binding protein [Aliiglaciecola sp. LCG003]WJG10326.1 ABC transporter substrate-binding protein [Aliiglaciecola sp. LCG003]
MKIILLLLLVLGVQNAVFADEQATPKNVPLNALLFIHADPGFPFYDSTVLYAKSAAQALNIKLQVEYIPKRLRDRFGVTQFKSSFIDSLTTPPDIVISPLAFGAEEKFLTILAERKIPFISFNTYLSNTDFARLGKPRERFPLWLAHLAPNDDLAGAMLASDLITRATRIKQCEQRACNINLFAFTGLKYTSASSHRVDGLLSITEPNKQVTLLNTVDAQWSQNVVRGFMPTVLSRHNDVDVFWAASDIMAFGIIEGLKAYDKKLQTNPIIGSIDWSPDSIDLIRQQQLSVSYGGHFMEAGWALLMYFDYLAGHDFAGHTGTILSTQMAAMDQDNIAQIGDFLAAPNWSESQFKKLSMSLNPANKRYHFNPLDIVKAQIAENVAN